MENSERSYYLDGLRGLAILMVLFYHTYNRNGNELPITPFFFNLWIAKYGYLGVHLFFLLSGYLICQSAVFSTNGLKFITKRWLRLFPAMILASAIIYLTADYFFERPYGKISPINLLPGLSFLDEKLISYFFQEKISGIEGSFWSLYVEFKFYIWVMILFSFRKKSYFGYLIAIPFAYFLITQLLPENSYSEKMEMINTFSSAQHFGWFAIGALLYQQKMGNKISLIPISFILYESALQTRDFTPALWIGIFFILVVRYEWFLGWLSASWLVFLGYISYFLYLIHENILVSSTMKINQLNLVPIWISPLIPLSILIVFSYLATRFYEIPFRKFLIKLWKL